MFGLLLPCVAAFAARSPLGAAPAPPSSPAPAVPSPDADETPDPSLPPDVAALRAKIRAAEGKRPHRERVTETVHQLGRDDSLVIVRIGKNERTTFGSGTLSTSSGVHDGEAWHQNVNGLTVVDEAPDVREASEHRTYSLRHVTTPMDADVISALTPRGDGTLTYVDPTTSRIVRIDTLTPTGKSVTTYDDFRTTDGRTYAWHSRTESGGSVVEHRVTSIETSGITDADVAIPPPRRTLVEFPAGKPSVALPVSMSSDHKFIVHLTIGGRGADFILDTGAGGIAIDQDFAKSVGLTRIEEGTNAANAGRYAQAVYVVPQMSVGPLQMHDVVVGSTPSLAAANRDSPVKIVGLLGFDFIASVALTLDYEHVTVTATNYDAFVAPAKGQAIEVPIRFGTQQPETDVAIDGQVGNSFMIDSGGAGGVMLTDAFMRRHPGVTRGFLGGVAVNLGGVGGEMSARMYQVPKIRFGTATFTGFSAIVVDAPGPYSNFDGLIGADILRLFTVTTDYADSLIYLQKNSLGNQSAAAAH